MRLRPLLILAAATAATLLSPPSGAEELVVPGRGSPEFVLGVLAREFNSRQSAHKVWIPTSTGTAGGIRDVVEGKSPLGRVGRRLRPDELDKGLVFVPLGKDPVVFVAGSGAGDGVKTITRQQVLEVYRGKLVDWKQLGGAPGPILAIGRESGDAGREAIAKVIVEMKDLAFDRNVKVVHLDPQVIQLLDRFDTSFGFMNRTALRAATTKVSALALDGIAASPEAVTSGRYPITLEVGFIHRRGSLPDVAKAFVDFARSSEGAAILRREGLVLEARP